MSGWRRRSRSGPWPRLARIGTTLRWSLRALLVLLVLDLFYLAITWPDWHRLAVAPVPKSAFIVEYEQEHAHSGRPARAHWLPVALANIPRYLQRAVIVAEDSRFYEHSGFDLIAFKEAMDYNLAEGRLAVGASTISQQTVKNLFLSSSKSPLRKWHELVLTWGMEHHLSKARILELYLNLAEFGPGIYGVQAAAQAYWGINATQLKPQQAAELAASLPSPIKNNPATRTPQFEKRAARILRLMVHYPGDAAESLAGLKEMLDIGDDTDTAVAPSSECLDDDCPTNAVDQTPPPTTEPPAPQNASPARGQISPAS